jgi:hypothetical protein
VFLRPLQLQIGIEQAGHEAMVSYWCVARDGKKNIRWECTREVTTIAIRAGSRAIKIACFRYSPEICINGRLQKKACSGSLASAFTSRWPLIVTLLSKAETAAQCLPSNIRAIRAIDIPANAASELIDFLPVIGAWHSIRVPVGCTGITRRKKDC